MGDEYSQGVQDGRTEATLESIAASIDLIRVDLKETKADVYFILRGDGNGEKGLIARVVKVESWVHRTTAIGRWAIGVLAALVVTGLSYVLGVPRPPMPK